jgi:hypothetical protein
LPRRLALRRCRQPKPAAHGHATLSATFTSVGLGREADVPSHAKQRKGAEPKRPQRGWLGDCPLTFRGCPAACGCVRDPDDSPIGFISAKFTPTNFAPPENLRVTIEVSTAPEPGTRAPGGLDLTGLELLRHSRNRFHAGGADAHIPGHGWPRQDSPVIQRARRHLTARPVRSRRDRVAMRFLRARRRGQAGVL